LNYASFPTGGNFSFSRGEIEAGGIFPQAKTARTEIIFEHFDTSTFSRFLFKEAIPQDSALEKCRQVGKSLYLEKKIL
jgi:hypothetical protein